MILRACASIVSFVNPLQLHMLLWPSRLNLIVLVSSASCVQSLIRIQTRDGQLKLPVTSQTTVAQVKEKIAQELKLSAEDLAKTYVLSLSHYLYSSPNSLTLKFRQANGEANARRKTRLVASVRRR